MNRSEVADTLALLVALPFVNKPENPADPATFAAYLVVFADLEADAVRAAAKRHLLTSRFWPVASELREAVIAERLRIPSVAAAVAEIAALRPTVRNPGATVVRPVEDLAFSHPLVREAVREVGPEKILDDWAFAHRECETTYARLRREVLDAANLISAGAPPPPLPAPLALIAGGVDPWERPAAPALAAGEVWSGWTWSVEAQRWEGVICDAEWKTRGPYLLGFPRRPRPGAKYQRVTAPPVHESAIRAASA